jgi:hypothetical protein
MGRIGLTGQGPWYKAIAAWCRANKMVWDIPDHADPSITYLSRSYLLPGRHSNEDRLFCWFNAFIHEFFTSDVDGRHTHPWRFWISVVLSVGYWEETTSGLRWRRPGSIAFRGGLTCHRVILDPTKPRPWTLFIAGPKWVTWGFFLAKTRQWVPYWLNLFHPHLRNEWFARRSAAHARKIKCRSLDNLPLVNSSAP